MHYFKALPVFQYAALAQKQDLPAFLKSPADDGPLF
jgi:hypothetical protein